MTRSRTEVIKNSVICELITMLRANEIARITSDFKMDVLNELILPLTTENSSMIRCIQLKNVFKHKFDQIIRRKFTYDMKYEIFCLQNIFHFCNDHC